MSPSPEQEKKILIGLLIVLTVLVIYRITTAEKPRTAPLTYERGATASSPVRSGIATLARDKDPLFAFVEKGSERFPAVTRDIFRMYDPAPPRPKEEPKPPEPVLPPPPPEKSPEEIAAEAARADLSRFRFLGYLTDKDSSLFLSKDGELFIAKSGDTLLKNYKIKEAGKDYVILLDTITKVEVRVELTGGAEPPAGHRFR